MTTESITGSSDKSYVTLKKAKETTRVLKELLKRSQDKSGGGKKKPMPLIESNSEKIMLDVDFKKIPMNQSTFINYFGPVPHPWKMACDTLDMCLIVKDLDPRNGLKDRELDLKMTKDHYRDILFKAGFDGDFLSSRLYIMTMRELLTEYQLPEAKSKLAAAYDIFLADKKLMVNKFSPLKSFLGSNFWKKFKKVPQLVDMSLTGDELKSNILSALSSTCLYISGRGSTESLVIGTSNQSSAHLGSNLYFILKEIHTLFGQNVASLKITCQNVPPIVFFMDLGSSNEVADVEIAPQTKNISSMRPVIDDYPLLDSVNLIVKPGSGDFKIVPKRVMDEGDDDDNQQEDGVKKKKKKVDAYLTQLQSDWIRKTRHPVRKTRMSGKKTPKRVKVSRFHEVLFTEQQTDES